MKITIFALIAVCAAAGLAVGLSACKPEPEAPHVHIFRSEIIAPTEQDRGYTLHMCECGYSYTDDYTDKLGHTYTLKIIAPTCTAMGYTLHECTDCGDSYITDYTDVIGHF